MNAAEAGLLVGRHERIVRQHISRGDLPARKDNRGRWQINTDDLSRVPHWTVDRERLALLETRSTRTPAGLLARVEALEARLRSQDALLRAMESAITALRRQGPPPGTDVPPSEPDPSIDDSPPPTYRGPSTVSLQDRGADTPRTFRTRADAARWLERHGVNPSTVKGWPGWHSVALTPDATLSFALAIWRAAQAAGNWRITWRLHRCDDALCVCQVTL